MGETSTPPAYVYDRSLAPMQRPPCMSAVHVEVTLAGVTQLLVEEGLVPLLRPCALCGGELRLRARGRHRDPVYLCTTSVCLHHGDVRELTFLGLFKPKLPISSIVQATVGWIRQLPERDIIDVIFERRQVTLGCLRVLRRLMVRWLMATSTKIGGLRCNVIVDWCRIDLDESETPWAVFGVDRQNGRTFLQYIDKRSLDAYKRTTGIFVRTGSRRRRLPPRIKRMSLARRTEYLVMELWNARCPTHEERYEDFKAAITHFFPPV